MFTPRLLLINYTQDDFFWASRLAYRFQIEEAQKNCPVSSDREAHQKRHAVQWGEAAREQFPELLASGAKR